MLNFFRSLIGMDFMSHLCLRGEPEVLRLTTSASDVDIGRSYLLHANSYILKPVDREGFLTAVQSIDNFWLSIMAQPSGKAA